MKRIYLLISLSLLSYATAFAAESAKRLEAPKGRPIRVAVVLTEGATVIDFTGPWEVFSDVHVHNRGPTMAEQMPFDLFTVGASRDPIHTSGGAVRKGFEVTPDYTFADAPAADVVVIGAQKGGEGLSEYLRKMRGESQVVMSVCTGAFRLSQAGLLDGKSATTHHDFLDRLAKENPKITIVRSARFVQSDDVVYTAGGLSSGIDLALHIVEQYFGREVAQHTADYMEYSGAGWKL